MWTDGYATEGSLRRDEEKPRPEVNPVSSDGREQTGGGTAMRKLAVVVILVLPFVIGACPKTGPREATQAPTTTEAPQPAPAEAEWVEFTSDEHGFSVMMPETPKGEDQGPQDTPLGTMRFYMFAAMGKPIPYAVQAIHIPEEAVEKIDGAKFLELQSGRLIGTFEGAKVTKDEDISLGEHPGKALELDIPDSEKYPGGLLYITRIYYAGPRAYQLIVTVPKDYAEKENAEKFFDSFKLTGGEGAKEGE